MDLKDFWPQKDAPLIEKAQQFVEKYKGEKIVLKYGGQVMASDQLTKAFAQDAAIAVRPPRVFRIEFQNVVVEHPQRLDQRKGRAQMASLAAIEAAHHQSAQRERAFIEVVAYKTNLCFWRHAAISFLTRSTNPSALPSCRANTALRSRSP